MQMCRMRAVQKARSEHLGRSLLKAATDLEDAEQSFGLRQGVFRAAFHCSRDHPHYHEHVFFSLSIEQCANMLSALVFTVPSLLFGPRCASLADYYGGNDQVRARLKPVDSADTAGDNVLLRNFLHGELYRFLHQRFLAIYGVSVPNGTHIDTSINCNTLFFVCISFSISVYTSIPIRVQRTYSCKSIYSYIILLLAEFRV